MPLLSRFSAGSISVIPRPWVSSLRMNCSISAETLMRRRYRQKALAASTWQHSASRAAAEHAAGRDLAHRLVPAQRVEPARRLVAGDHVTPQQRVPEVAQRGLDLVEELHRLAVATVRREQEEGEAVDLARLQLDAEPVVVDV